MPYEARITRANPGCILFVVDQSFSMTDPCPGFEAGKEKQKAQALADVINRTLQNLIVKCTAADGVRDYFDVGVIGYTTDPNAAPIIGPQLAGALQGRELVRLSELHDNPLEVQERQRQVEDGAGGLTTVTTKFPVWLGPVAIAGTPMRSALQRCQQTLEQWIPNHTASFPPIVIHVTDGESDETDGDPLPAADSLKGLATNDGNVLLFNIHLSSFPAPPTTYPTDATQLPDPFAKKLFDMSSLIPDKICLQAESEGLPIKLGSRGMVFNADVVSLIKFLDTGTKVAVANLR